MTLAASSASAWTAASAASSASRSRAASSASPTRPAALSRGAIANETVSRSTAAGATFARSSSAAMPGRGARRMPLETEPGDGPVLADHRRDVRDRPDRCQVGQVQGRGGAAGLPREEQLGDLERDAAPGQATVRVGRIRLGAG